MSREAFDHSLTARFGARVRRDAPLAPLTTFKVGGPADWLLEGHDLEDVRSALALAAGQTGREKNWGIIEID